LQHHQAAGDWVAYRSLWQQHYKEAGLALDDFGVKLSALDALAGGLMMLQPRAELVLLRQSPDKIADHVRRSLG
jgi:hypothetical protein